MAVLVAPAGYGKTTLLREWEMVDERPFVWLTLTERYNEPARLIGSVAAALNDVEPIDEDVFTALSSARPNIANMVVPRLCDSLLEREQSLALVLDDLHSVRNPKALAPLTAIADCLPWGSQLVLSSRGEPRLPIARLRAHRSLVELHAPELAMTRSEASELLRASGLELDPAALDRLVAHTEGWPAALYLAALSLMDEEDLDLAVERFAGDDRLVADYVHDEYVSSLAPEQVSFLTRTSILDELSGELCDAVLRAEGSAELLVALARSHGLVSPLDSKDHAFHYHALLREMLESELHRLSGQDEATLHERASVWYAERADYDHAVPHAIATGDVDAAGALIWLQAANYASTGREATLERWLDSFTQPQIDASPELCLVRATCALAAGNGAAVSHWTSQALELLERMPRAGGNELKVAAATLRAAGSAREGVVRMRTDALTACELLPDESPWQSVCRLLEGAASHLTHEPGLARIALEEGARTGAAVAPSIRNLCLAQLALLAIDEGDPDDAAQLSGDSIRGCEMNALADQPAMALVFAVAASVEAHVGNASAASGHAKKARGLLEALTEMSPWYEAETRIALARALALLEDVAEARALLADAGRELRRTPDAPVLREWLEQAWKEADSATASGRWPLTPAELRVLHYLPTHLTFPEIAAESFVSTNTVKTQARSIYSKLGVKSRAEAVAFARTAGLVADEPPFAPNCD